MTIVVANRSLLGSSSLSELAHQVLRFIDGGLEWLNWAIVDTAHHYQFPDEAGMLAAVQSGLHGRPTLLLRRLGLTVGPVKLMTMAINELQHLARAERGDIPVPRELLARHHLVAQTDLNRIPGFLEELGVADAPVFQVRSLGDLLMLVHLLDEVEAGAPHAIEAARFAAANADDIAQFVDYVRCYLDRARTSRAVITDGELTVLLPAVFGALNGLEVGRVLSALELQAAVREWLGKGQRLGFTRASLAIQQLVADGGYDGQRGEPLTKLVRDFVERSQRLLDTAEIGRGQLGQDGITATYFLTANGEAAEIELSATGLVTLARFGRVAQRKPRPDRDGATPKQRARRGVSAVIS